MIVSSEGQVLGEGFHLRKGTPHAEAAALAATRARGVSAEEMGRATAYVTLEPCHRGPGKTTPPCDEAIVASGLREVHIALLDPDPTFGNAGVAHLREAGVRVSVGTLAAEVEASLRPYLHHRCTRLPYVVLKVRRGKPCAMFSRPPPSTILLALFHLLSSTYSRPCEIVGTFSPTHVIPTLRDRSPPLQSLSSTSVTLLHHVRLP